MCRQKPYTINLEFTLVALRIKKKLLKTTSSWRTTNKVDTKDRNTSYVLNELTNDRQGQTTET